MTDVPQFETVTPTVLDARRVSIHLKTINLPEQHGIGCMVNFNDANNLPKISLSVEPPPAPTTPAPPPEAPEDMPAFEQSKFPVVEVNLVDANQQSVAHAMIIEHRDPELDITLHIREPQIGSVYTAYAEMIYQQKLVQVVEAPFVLETDGVETQ